MDSAEEVAAILGEEEVDSAPEVCCGLEFDEWVELEKSVSNSSLLEIGGRGGFSAPMGPPDQVLGTLYTNSTISSLY